MLHILWLVFVTQLVVAFILERRVRSPFLFIWPIVFLFVGLPIGLEILGVLKTQSHQVMMQGLAYGIVFNFFYLAGFFVALLSAPSAHMDLEPIGLFRTQQQFRVFVLFVASLILGMLLVNGVNFSTVVASDWRYKSEMGFASVIIVWLLSLLAGCLCFAIDKKHKSMIVLIFFVFVVVLAFYRSRGVFANFFIAGAVFWVLHRRGRVLPLVAASVVAILCSVFIRALRFLGSYSSVTSIDELVSLFREHISLIFDKGDLSIYKVYLSVIEKCGYEISCFNFTYIASIGKVLRVADADSLRIEYSLYTQLVEGGVGGSLHPTAYGVIFADFSWVGGAVFFLLIGVFHALIRNVFRGERMLLLLGFIGSYTVFFARGSIYNSLSALIIGLVLAYVLTFLFGARWRVHGNA